MNGFFEVPVPGSTVTACLIKYWHSNRWDYSLWEWYETDDEHCLGKDTIYFQNMEVTPDQVARVAFLLECEYGTDK